ncbi:sensor histidine kinase [Azospirillum agricola]|uniref:sensor histidine kinase n=1 Tax=Azospirillum agricola TaxID=1720247 RepID=UPI000A0F10F6|nr:PAS domain S-box protein [Azospirillum agricola]SMH53808.1 PAS domain S-box-containing protein [Azospirillum lipoferum]
MQVNEQSVRALMRNARDVAAVVSPAGVVLYASDAAMRVLGYPADRLVGTFLIDHAHPDDRAEVLRRMTARLEGPAGSSGSAVFRFRHADGRWLRVEAVGYNQLDEPAIRGLVLNVRDVTEQLDTADRLRASEARYQTLAESAPVGIFQTDAAGGIVFANARFVSITGLTPDGVLGDGWLSAVHSDDRALVEADWRRGLTGQGAEGGEGGEALATLLLDFRFHDPRAAVDMPVLCQRVRLGDGSGFIGTVTDVSEYVRTANALLVSEARTKAILDAAADAILTMDENGIVRSFNRAAEEMFGVPAADMLWRPLDALMPAVHLLEEDGQRAAFAPGQTTAVIARARCVTVQRADGTPFPVELSVSASEIDGRRLYTGIIRDVTERRRIEAEIIAAKEAAEAADRAKSVFVATMSHELRTPLNAVIGFAQLMEMRLRDPASLDRCIEYTSSIRQSGEQLLAIIDDILDMARVEAGGLVLAAGPVDLSALVTQTVAQMEFQAARVSVAVEQRCDGDLPPIRGDERRLRQALCNLLSNAIKFSHPDGVVTVSAGLAADGGVELVVRDHGIGLEPGDIPKALAAFVQLDQSMTRRYEGLGLGLPLSQRLIEAHGGTLTLDSRPGEGCTATIRLPASRIMTLDELLAGG